MTNYYSILFCVIKNEYLSKKMYVGKYYFHLR